MQVYGNSNRLSAKTILTFTTVLILAFLPVSSFLFFLKNDAFNGYFPPKFFTSESIHAGYLPLWNPYINFGMPQYGDMSGGYWSPVTWLVASTVGYNAYTLTLEALFYILIGGIGMYKLTRLWINCKHVRIMAGVAFMCCGYNVGHLQHFNWLSGAAFLPWCLYSYVLMLEFFSFKNAVRAAVIFYMLIASAHPGIIIGAIYFFAAVMFFHLFKNKASTHKLLKPILKSNAVLLLLLLALSAGLITGYADILPYFIRGEKISLNASLSNPTNLQSWISVLLPFATVKNDAYFNTDPSMRNCYFSLAFLIFFIAALIHRKSAFQKFLLGTGLLFALLSSGGVFKILAYKILPLIGFVRLNGEFSIFALLCFIVFAAITCDQFISRERKYDGTLKKIFYSAGILLIIAIVTGLYNSFAQRESFIFHIQDIGSKEGLSMKLKSFIDSISFYDTWWIQGFLQLLILLIIKQAIKLNNSSLLKNVLIADMIIASLLNIPFTGVGKNSVHDVQQVLNKSPKEIPVPSFTSVHDTISKTEEALVGNWAWYNKQIGDTTESAYPVALKNMRSYFERLAAGETNIGQDEPWLFLEDSFYARMKVVSYSGHDVVIKVEADSTTILVLKQNFYPHWYYILDKKENTKRPVNLYKINFMSVPVSTGTHLIEITFRPTKVIRAMIFSGLAFISACVFLLLPIAKQSYPLQQRQQPYP